MKKLIIGLLLVVLLLVPAAACGGKQEEGSVVMPTMPTPTPAPTPPTASASGGEKAYSDEYNATATDTERMIVRTGDMALVVEDINQAIEDITQMSLAFGGYVVASYIQGQEEEMTGWISFRVPDEKFEAALTQLRALAVRVESEQTSSQDVTEEYIDLEARLTNAKATEQQYLALLDKAVDVEDIINIYSYLSQVRQEIEQLEGQIKYLEQTTSTSLISVSLKPEKTEKPLVHAGWSALEVLKAAARGIVSFGQWLGTIAIWLLIFIPIWGTILAIILWRRHKRRARK
jgi:hypothetical protein